MYRMPYNLVLSGFPVGFMRAVRWLPFALKSQIRSIDQHDWQVDMEVMDLVSRNANGKKKLNIVRLYGIVMPSA
jgi:hypothetical protein